VYWKLDDAGGVAADASGNGYAGAYSGGRQVLAPGPEVGTFSVALLNNFGSVILNPWAGSIAGSATVEVWAAVAQLAVGTNILGYEGTTGGNGGGVYLDANGQLVLLHGAIGIAGTGVFVSDVKWHQYAETLVFPGNASVVYFDGAPVLTTTLGYLNATALNVGGGGPGSPNGLFAHFAAWNSALTGAQIAAHFAARVNPQDTFQGTPLLSVPNVAFAPGSGGILDLIYAAVHRSDYP
jgi:Concanavalin A-like lectin/glucanases superfamily